jgi:hypothetical protein
VHYNDGPILVHTRYLDSRNYEGVRRTKCGSVGWIYEEVTLICAVSRNARDWPLPSFAENFVKFGN